MLWDKHHPELPYTAIGAWPRIYLSPTEQEDWITSVNTVEEWLETSVGRHWVEWTWSTWSLLDSHLVNDRRWFGVSFRYEPHVTLFLLRFGE